MVVKCVAKSRQVALLNNSGEVDSIGGAAVARPSMDAVGFLRVPQRAPQDGMHAAAAAFSLLSLLSLYYCSDVRPRDNRGAAAAAAAAALLAPVT